MPSKYVRERMSMKNKPRKVLNLEERVLAIRLYQQTPVYQRVATVFKCSWEQIKNVVRNSDEILQYYKRCQVIEPTDSAHYVRYKKINFLGSAMYEFIKRAYYYRSATLNNETLRKKALQFRDILKIDRFYPNWAWVADFKHVFNIDFERLHTLIIHESPHKSLDVSDIVAHCTRTVERTLACSGKIKSAKGAAANKSNAADDYDSAEEDFENADDGSIIGRLEHDDAEDVAAVSEGDDFKDQYLDDADDDEINENEEGPTIDFGTYEYDGEMQELRAATPTPPAADAQTTATKATTANSLPANSPMRTELQAAHSPVVQIKVECRSRSPSPVSNTAMPPPPANRSAHRKTSTATVEPSNCILETTNTNATTTTTTGSISSYAEALQWLRPLEDFAYQEEDFHAVNFLAQLAQLYERRAKQPKTFHTA